MSKRIDEMTEAEVRAYAKELERRLAHYEKPDFVTLFTILKPIWSRLGTVRMCLNA